MSNDLIERLRTNNCDNLYEFSLRKEAAKALEAKDAKIERLEATLRGAYTENKAYAKRIAELEGALREIAKGEGRYDMDPLKHCGNTVEDMIGLAKQALGGDDE